MRETIDVLSRVPSRSMPASLGSVNGGEQREFTLPEGAQSVYTRTASGMVPTRETRDQVRVRYVCR
jgi:hypothetical protein